MKPLVAKTVARVWGSENAWSLSPPAGSKDGGRECEVELEIQGDDGTGYHLVMSPAGFFTADTWHPTREEALGEANDLFGLAESDWRSVEGGE